MDTTLNSEEWRKQWEAADKQHGGMSEISTMAAAAELLRGILMNH